MTNPEHNRPENPTLGNDGAAQPPEQPPAPPDQPYQPQTDQQAQYQFGQYPPGPEQFGWPHPQYYGPPPTYGQAPTGQPPHAAAYGPASYGPQFGPRYAPGQYPYVYAYASNPPPPGAAPKHRRGRIAMAAGAGLIAAGVVVATVVATSGASSSTGGSGAVGTNQTPNSNQGGTGNGNTGNGGGNFPLPGGGYFPFPGTGGPGTGGTGQTRSTQASDDQKKGVVIIDTVLGYENAAAAGTGMVLTSDGEIVTNNHVVQGATKITVTVAATGTRYAATVVGTDATDDVAVIKLANASGLKTADLANDDNVAVGDAVTAVGNAGGTGTLTAAAGTVVATGQSITASDETGSNSETLHNLIQISADVVAGDSGGPLYDSDGQIIGMDTAASSGNGGTSSGYAITIADAKSIANQIEKGVETSRIRIGNPGLLGVTATGAGGGATVDQVLSGGAADTAGISVGDVITRFDGKTISSADDLHEAAGRTDAGQRVRVTWTDSFGSTHTATLTLGTGPAD